MIVYSFLVGYTATRVANKAPAQVATDMIPHYKRDKLREIMIQTANDVHKKIMNRFSISYMPYVCVALDEGSTQKRKLLDFVLENPTYPAPSYPAVTERLMGLKTADYTVAISNAYEISKLVLIFFYNHQQFSLSGQTI